VLESTQMQKGCVHPCTYMQTDTTIPLLSWWAVGECGRLWTWKVCKNKFILCS